MAIVPPALRNLAWLLRPDHKLAFLLSLPPNAAILDVGCGNNSAKRAKRARPDLRYVGLDIGDYNQAAESKEAMDRYVLNTPARFAEAIKEIGECFDGVISAHNIEHCNEPFEVIAAMCAVLKPGGRLYLSFPTEDSVNFPSRHGTLNFHDDPTHRDVPRWEAIKTALEDAGMTLDRAVQRSRPIPFMVAGMLLEPVSALRKKVDRYGAAWAWWGFESIIWARRTGDI